MKSTAINWLKNKLFNEFGFTISDNIFDEAKEMEKDQMIDAFLSSHSKWIGDAESYYQDTYSHPDPSDDEIYNNFNHEGGIKFTKDEWQGR